MNEYAKTDLQDVKIYAISHSTPEEHSSLQETYGLDGFQFLSEDGTKLEFGVQFGFYDAADNNIYRGYVGVNPDSENVIVKVNYLVGDNINEVLQLMGDL